MTMERTEGDYWTMEEGYFAGAWIVKLGDVNLDDMVSMRPGRIVRVMDMNSIKYVPPSMDDYARIAGLISDAA